MSGQIFLRKVERLCPTRRDGVGGNFVVLPPFVAGASLSLSRAAAEKTSASLMPCDGIRASLRNRRHYSPLRVFSISMSTDLDTRGTATTTDGKMAIGAS